MCVSATARRRAACCTASISTIAPGERIGLVGRSGAGKSTLVNLLLRFYELESGRILIDGQDIAGVTQESLRAQIAMVTQDTSLLHRSIRDNIRYGRPEASEAEILDAAAARARASSSSRGSRIGRAGAASTPMSASAASNSRAASASASRIARVILKDAPILVLDEATSALDSEVEAAIQEQLDGLMKGRTVIAIAHRLSTIARMDRLVVLDQGRIVEEGAHDQLLARGGAYAALWRRQSGGFRVDIPGFSRSGARRNPRLILVVVPGEGREPALQSSPAQKSGSHLRRDDTTRRRLRYLTMNTGTAWKSLTKPRCNRRVITEPNGGTRTIDLCRRLRPGGDRPRQGLPRSRVGAAPAPGRWPRAEQHHDVGVRADLRHALWHGGRF